MNFLANRTRTLYNSRSDPSAWITEETATGNPYGDGWDLLWLGSCANPPGSADSQFFPGEDGSQQHWVWYVRGGMLCNWAVAITRAGAKSLFAWLQDTDTHVDEAMSEWCVHSDCIAVWPTLFGSFQSPGTRTESDNDPSRLVEDEIKEYKTPGIVHSATVDVLQKLGQQFQF